MNNPRNLRIAIFVLALTTALVHAWLFYTSISPRFAGFYPFLVNAGIYLLLIGAFFIPQISFNDMIRRILHYIFILYTAGSIGAWVTNNAYPNYLNGRPPSQLELSIFDKTVEVLLIVALFLHLRSMNAKMSKSAR